MAAWNEEGNIRATRVLESRRGMVFSGQREAVTKEMLQRRSEWNISVLVLLDHRYAEARSK